MTARFLLVTAMAVLFGTVSASPAASSSLPTLSQFRGGAEAVAAAEETATVDDQTPSIPPSTATAAAGRSNKNAAKKKTKVAVAQMEENKMPSLFITADEIQYDRYAACLAATEGLRKARDIALQKKPSEENEGKGGKLFKKGGGETYGVDTLEYKRAQAQYLLQSTKVIRALGLTVSQFNQMGREIGNDEQLKEKVMEQAFLYRMAATVDLKKVPLIEFPQSEKLLKSQKQTRIQMFARSMTDIEELRTEQIERLRKALHVDRLPEGVNICDPAIRPILSPKVRAVVEAFPLQAETIVRKYGLNSDEFNEMLEETKSNPILRWKVRKHMGKNSGSNKGQGKGKK